MPTFACERGVCVMCVCVCIRTCICVSVWVCVYLYDVCTCMRWCATPNLSFLQ